MSTIAEQHYDEVFIGLLEDAVSGRVLLKYTDRPERFQAAQSPQHRPAETLVAEKSSCNSEHSRYVLVDRLAVTLYKSVLPPDTRKSVWPCKALFSCI
jgi:hypothetical protein